MARRSSSKDRNKPVAQLVVEARLLDVGIPAPKPGIVYTLSLMQYEVLKIIHGEYSHPSIFVGHHNPNLAGRDFIVGGKHRLHLTEEFPEHANILDKFQTSLSKTESYFCLSFEVLE